MLEVEIRNILYKTVYVYSFKVKKQHKPLKNELTMIVRVGAAKAKVKVTTTDRILPARLREIKDKLPVATIIIKTQHGLTLHHWTQIRKPAPAPKTTYVSQDMVHVSELGKRQ